MTPNDDNNLASPRRLYGRDRETAQLTALSQSLSEATTPARVCFVHGLSGSGKTSLCEQLRQSKVVFLGGKCDQFQDYSAPYSALVQAFEHLGDERLVIQNNSRVQQVLEEEGQILVRLIPSLARLVSSPPKTATDDDNTPSSGAASPPKRESPERRLELASERLAVGFRSLLRVLCTPQSPLVLFLDDLQWCDPSSLEILTALVDPEIRNFLLLGGYRDEEADQIQSFLQQITGSQHYTDIAIGNLEPVCVQEMIVDVLGVSSTDHDTLLRLKPFTDLVHQKTGGNPYFVLQFLGILKREQLLSHNHDNHQWEWNISAIQSQLLPTSAPNDDQPNNNSRTTTTTQQTNGVAYFVTQRILTQSPDLRRILQLMACLGYSVNLQLLETLDRMEWERQPKTNTTTIEHHSTLFQRALEHAISEKLLLSTGSLCSFTHDRVQQCVYELIPNDDQAGSNIRNQLHLRTGQHLMQLYQSQPSHSQPTEWLFLAADQCNRGSASLPPDERLTLIQLNLQASQAARSKAGASLVALFLDKAVALTRDEDWTCPNMYDMVLEVYSLSAQVESARGNYARSDQRVQVILERAKSPQDTVRAIAVRAQTHGAQQEYNAALTEMKRALALLGVKVPQNSSQPQQLHLRIELWKLKRFLQHKTEQELLALKPMTDQRMLLAMKILQMGVIWGWNADAVFGLLCYTVMVRISIRYGRCYLTPFAFAGLGNILATMGDDAKGYWCGQLACHFEEGKESFPSSTMVVHCYLAHLRKPASESLETLLKAYRVSLETGDLYMGTICICVHHWVYKFCGLPLDNFVADLRNYLSELKLCHQDYLLAFLLPDLHFALNLTGETQDPLAVSWEVIERAESFTYKTVLSDQHLIHPAELNRCYTQLFNAILLGDTKVLEETIDSIQARKKQFRRFDGSHVANQFFAFWDGLACFALLRTYKGSRKYTRKANDAIKVLTRMSKGGSVNCVGMLQLLKAEKKSLDISSSKEVDKFLYDDAISQLFRSGFVHYSAIANERAGEFMLRRKEQYWAEKYLTRALDLYQKWGAVVKTRQLLSKYPFVGLTKDEYNGVEVAVHGRRRYSALLDSMQHVSGDCLDGEFKSSSMSFTCRS